MRIGTYNIHEFDRHRRSPSARDRNALVTEVIQGLDCDVIALQEICGRGRAALEDLAEATGMYCWHEPRVFSGDGDVGQVAIAGTGSRVSDFHVGLLWNPARVHAHRDGFRGYPGGEFWHGMGVQTFDVDGTDQPVHVGSYHGHPFGLDSRPDEARRVQSALTRPGADRLAIIGGDWNSISADRVQETSGTWRYWHPDPYWSQEGSNEWIGPYGYQCTVTENGPDGMPTRWHADRRPGEALLHAGCRDAAALAGAEWTPTVGHQPDADMGQRTIDTHRVSPALTPAVVGWHVVDTPETRTASDHLPVITELDLSRV